MSIPFLLFQLRCAKPVNSYGATLAFATAVALAFAMAVADASAVASAFGQRVRPIVAWPWPENATLLVDVTFPS